MSVGFQRIAERPARQLGEEHGAFA